MKRSSTTEQLRRDIDSGLTGDKVAAGDPAAVPLGVDEEAAGTPVPPKVIEFVRRRETRLGRRADAGRSGAGAAWRGRAIVALFAAVALAAWVALRRAAPVPTASP